MRIFDALVMLMRRVPWQEPPQWEESDGRQLAAFMGSATGQKLHAALVSEIAAANERAALSKGSAFECGWACGYRGLLAWFQSLSASSSRTKEENTETDPFGETGGLEHLSP